MATKKAENLEKQEKLRKAYEGLKRVRESKTVTLKRSGLMRDTFTALDGSEQPFRLRYYQVQGIYHLLVLKRMVLGDDTGLGKCTSGETQVLTDRGLLPIWTLAPEGELEPDHFYPPRLPVRVWTGTAWAPVKQFYWNGEKPTLKVTSRRGYTVEGSLQHPVLVFDTETGSETFVRLPDLDPERHWVCIDRTQDKFPVEEPVLPELKGLAFNARPYGSPSQLTPQLARLLAYVVAESWCNHRMGVNITQHRDLNPEVHDDIRDLLRQVYGWEGNQEATNRDISISVSSVHIREHLRLCGVEETLSAGKAIPWVVRQGTKDSVREFLRGLLDAEGSVCAEGGFEFSSASKDLANDVHLQLLRFGVVSSLSTKKVKGRPSFYWKVSFFGDDARLFLDRIGLVSSRKVEALREALQRPSNPNKDVVPGPILGEMIRIALLEGTSRGLKQFGTSLVNTLNNTRNFGRALSYNFLRETLPLLEDYAPGSLALKEVQRLLARGLYYDPIATITEGQTAVMDLEVDHPSHSFVGNGFVNHNTIEAISAMCHLFEREPNTKVLIVTPKSTVHQWASEIRRFTKGIRPLVAESPKKSSKLSPLEARKAVYREWADAPVGEGHEKVVLIINYALLVRDWNAEGFQPVKENGKPDFSKPVVPGVLDQAVRDVAPDKGGGQLVAFLDEAQAFKNQRTKTWEIVRFTSSRAHRAYALTATLLESNLMEGYFIYKAIKPDLFGNKTQFLKAYCHTELQKIPGKTQKIPIVVGYKNIPHYRETIDPFFLGRFKHEVSDELPTIISKDIVCELSDAENKKYGEALSGVIELGDGEVKDFEEFRTLVALIYCQQVVDSLSLLKFEAGDLIDEMFDYELLESKDIKVGALGAKEQALVDLVGEGGELEGEKVIVYTRFASLVPRLQKVLEKQKVKSVFISGKASEKKRQEAQALFQNSKSDVKVIFITDAGGMGINLQMAKALVFYDLPWTWGKYVQTLGRMVRIGSPHTGVVVYHLLAERPFDTGSRKTIDHHTLALLRKKKHLIDQVLGEGIKDALTFEKDTINLKDLLREMQEEAKEHAP